MSNRMGELLLALIRAEHFVSKCAASEDYDDIMPNGESSLALAEYLRGVIKKYSPSIGNISTEDGCKMLMQDPNCRPYQCDFYVPAVVEDRFDIRFPWHRRGSLTSFCNVRAYIFAKNPDHARELIEASFSKGLSFTHWETPKPIDPKKVDLSMYRYNKPIWI